MAESYPTPDPTPGSQAETPPTVSPAESASQPRYEAFPPEPVQPLSPADERTWAMLAHLSVLTNLVTGFLGPAAALVIYLIYKDRSRFVAFHSMQSFVFQMVWWVGGGILTAAAWAISGALAVILIGCLLMPVALLVSLIPLAALVYGLVAGLQVNQGRDFRYWLIGDWVGQMLS